MKSNKYLFVLVLLFLFSGCAVKKPKVSKIEVGKTLSSSERKSLISELEERHILYTTFNGKAKTKLDVNNKSFNATLNLRIKHKEAIWISVTAFLGIEVARVLITPDSIKILNRLQGEYTDKPFNYIYNFTSEKLGFNELEDLIIGNAMNFTFNQQVDFFHTTLGYEAQGVDSDLEFLMQFGNNLTLLQNKLSQKTASQTLTSNYSNFQEILNQQIPRNVQISIKADELDLNAIMDYNSIALNEELNLSFQIPSSYKQIN